MGETAPSAASGETSLPRVFQVREGSIAAGIQRHIDSFRLPGGAQEDGPAAEAED